MVQKIDQDTLYVGGDDSNHAGNSKCEIIVATFSRFCEDGTVRDFSNTRNYSNLSSWVNSKFRDYRFGLLVREEYRHSNLNLIAIIPDMIKKFLDEEELKIKNLKIYLDGRCGKETEEIKDKLCGFHGIEKVAVKGFIKKQKNEKGNISKHPRCPIVTYYADLLAHDLFTTKTFEELVNHEKLVLVK